MAPKVSIIIPAYNQTRYLGEAIQSALEQTYHPYEIIVVDDGSTDDTPQVIRSFGNRITSIRQANVGLAGARNTGIRASEGDLIGLLDADDMWLPNYLEVMLPLAEQDTDCAAFYCGARGMDSDGNDLPQTFGCLTLTPQDLYWELLRANFIIPSTTLIRRDCLMKAGLFDQALRSCEDWDLWLRLLPEYKIRGVNEGLVRYRIHKHTLSTDPSAMQYATKAVMEKHFGKDDGNYTEWTPSKCRAFGGVYRYNLLSSIQRLGDWASGARYLKHALMIDPTLSTDLSLFYDLALGSQPPGFRGTNNNININANASHTIGMLDEVFSVTDTPQLRKLKKKTYGTAYYALGLLSYNLEEKSLSKKYIAQAIYHRPELGRSSLAMGDMVKSFLPNRIRNWAKSLLHRN